MSSLPPMNAFFTIQLDAVCCRQCKRVVHVDIENEVTNLPLRNVHVWWLPTRKFTFSCRRCKVVFIDSEQQFYRQHIGDIAVNPGPRLQEVEPFERIDQ